MTSHLGEICQSPYTYYKPIKLNDSKSRRTKKFVKLVAFFFSPTCFTRKGQKTTCVCIFFVSLLEKNLIALILFRYRSKSYLVFPRSMDKSFSLVHPYESDLRINNVVSSYCVVFEKYSHIGDKNS